MFMSEIVLWFGISCVQFQASVFCLLALRSSLICPTTVDFTCCDSQLFSIKSLWKRITSSNALKADSLVLCLVNCLYPGVSQKQQPCIPKDNFFLLLFLVFYHLEMYKTENKMHNDYVKS